MWDMRKGFKKRIQNKKRTLQWFAEEEDEEQEIKKKKIETKKKITKISKNSLSSRSVEAGVNI